MSFFLWADAHFHKVSPNLWPTRYEQREQSKFKVRWKRIRVSLESWQIELRTQRAADENNFPISKHSGAQLTFSEPVRVVTWSPDAKPAFDKVVQSRELCTVGKQGVGKQNFSLSLSLSPLRRRMQNRVGFFKHFMLPFWSLLTRYLVTSRQNEVSKNWIL